MFKSRGFLAIAAAVALGAGVFATAPASAAPMVDPFVNGATESGAPTAEKARVVCNAWGRCWRTAPRYYAPRFYGRPVYRGRVYGRPYGYRRGYRRW